MICQIKQLAYTTRCHPDGCERHAHADGGSTGAYHANAASLGSGNAPLSRGHGTDRGHNNALCDFQRHVNYFSPFRIRLPGINLAVNLYTDGMGMCCEKKTDWVKKCIEYEVEGARPRGRPKKTWRDCAKRLSGTYIEQG